MSTIYTVHAYRWGERENHSYLVGVYDDLNIALKSSEEEELYRGGKYECEVLGWEINLSRRGNYYPKEIKPIGKI